MSSDNPDPQTHIDKVIESFTTDAAYKERVRVFKELDRWTKDDPVLLVVDAAATTMGESYFNQVKPQVESFRNEFISTGNITTLKELAAVGSEFKEHLPGERKYEVTTQIATYLANRSEPSDLESLKSWAQEADPSAYPEDPIGQINGVGLRTFQFLRMLAGVDAIKPDTHVSTFVEEVAAELPEISLETGTDQETLESCYWLAVNSSYTLIELDQIAWWHFADVPDETRQKYLNHTGERQTMETEAAGVSDQESLYRGVCALFPGQSCWYESTSHEYTKNSVTVAGPIKVFSDRTIVPIRGPQQDEPGYFFKADHNERKAYQRFGNEGWNEIKRLEVEF